MDSIIVLIVCAAALLVVAVGAWCLADLCRAAAQRRRLRDLQVLRLLAGGPKYGLELVLAGIDGRGTIYVRTNRLEERGLIVSDVVEPPPGDIGLPRRMFAITPAGRALLAEAR